MIGQNVQIVNQLVDEEEGLYRVLDGERIRYLRIDAQLFDDDTMCRPYLLIPQLPSFPIGEWTTMHMQRRATDGEHDKKFDVEVSSLPLRSSEVMWHPVLVDILTLPKTRTFDSGVHEVVYQGQPAICKYACFEWQLNRIEQEMWAFQHLEESLPAGAEPVAPKFLGHVTEHGRIMGFLMEKLEGSHADADDLEICTKLLKRVHNLGILHGDVNRHNFLIERKPGGRALLIDWETAEFCDEESAIQELQSLQSQLSEETGRGGFIRVKEHCTTASETRSGTHDEHAGGPS